MTDSKRLITRTIVVGSNGYQAKPLLVTLSLTEYPHTSGVVLQVTKSLINKDLLKGVKYRILKKLVKRFFFFCSS